VSGRDVTYLAYGATDDDGTVGVMEDVITDAAHDRTSNTAETSSSNHDHRHSVVFSHLTDDFTRPTAALRLDVTAYLITSHTRIQCAYLE